MVNTNSLWREKELYQWLKVNVYDDLERYKERVCYTDCFSIKKNLEIELKCRDKHWENMIIEKFKYDNLINRAETHNRIPIYICHSNTGIFEWDLTKFEITWENKDNLPTTTFFKNNKRIIKKVGYLDTNKANILKKLDLGDWY